MKCVRLMVDMNFWMESFPKNTVCRMATENEADVLWEKLGYDPNDILDARDPNLVCIFIGGLARATSRNSVEEVTFDPEITVTVGAQKTQEEQVSRKCEVCEHRHDPGITCGAGRTIEGVHADGCRCNGPYKPPVAGDEDPEDEDD